jgi:hypothetical protein
MQGKPSRKAEKGSCFDANFMAILVIGHPVLSEAVSGYCDGTGLVSTL